MNRLGRESKCIWCNKAEGSLLEVKVTVPNRLGLEPREEVVQVHAAHEASTRAFLSALTAHGKRFLVGVAVLLVLTVIAAVAVLILESQSGTGAAPTATLFAPLLLGLAAWMWIYPFATPETVRWLGIRKAVAAVRLSALAVVALAWLVWMGVAAARAGGL